MRHRILRSIVAVTALAVVVLSVPLGAAVAALYRDDAVRRLVDDAARAGTAVPAPLDPADPVELPPTEDGADTAAYRPDGARLAGAGPPAADAVTRAARRGHVASASTGAEIAAAVPVGGQEQVVAAVRAALPLAAVDGRIHRAWLVMAGFGAAAIATAAAVSVWQARRLSRPLESLTEAAARLGGGDFSVRAPSSGVAEIDTVAAAINVTADRLARVLERERAFSADASHQIRTPLAALRLRLESHLMSAPAEQRPAVAGALEEVERLQRTVDDLLRLARDAPRDRGALDVRALLAEMEGPWRARLAALDRPLRVDLPEALPAVAVSVSAVRQILEVLVDNAAVHGAGAVRVGVRERQGAVVVDVEDEGDGVRGDVEAVFARRRSGMGGSGIGLALARSLAEAEGGRLLLVRASPHPIFRLALLADDSGTVQQHARD